MYLLQDYKLQVFFPFIYAAFSHPKIILLPVGLVMIQQLKWKISIYLLM